MFYGVIDIVSLIDNDYNILMVNQAFEDLLTKPEESCIGKKCYKIIRNRKTPCEDCPMFYTKTDNNKAEELLVPIGKDEILLRRHPIYNEGGKTSGVFEIGRIVTKEKKMERELRHQGRLKIMGELISSIIHEIKNPLAGIGLMTISIMERLNKDDEINKDLGSILHEVQRLEKFIKDLMNFSKPNIFQFEKLNIHKLIDNNLNLLKSKIKLGNIKIRKKYNLNIPNIKIDSSKIKQVFFNIFLNSIIAIPNGGEIIISTSIYKKEVNEIKNDYLQIIIKDNGVGIKDEDLPKIFDPFFSKSPKGTGLGLSIVYKIIEYHNGTIFIKSQEGKGTTVKILIPFN